MTEGDLTCGKCKTPLEINAAHVTFRDGKKAYIKCPNPECNNTRRVTWDLVEHLKPNNEAVKIKDYLGLGKVLDDAVNHRQPLQIIPIKFPVKSPSAEGEIPEAIKQALSEENNAPEPKKQDDGEGWGWVLGGIAGLLGLGALIALARRK